jgi:hypothetical protein
MYILLKQSSPLDIEALQKTNRGEDLNV